MARSWIMASARARLFTVAAVTAALLVAAALFVIVSAAPLSWPEFSVEVFEEFILSLGAWGVIGSVALMILHSFVPFPSEFVAFANGMVYGPIWGTVVTWTGAMLGAFCAFGLARVLGRPFVEIFVAERKLHGLDEWVAEHGLYVILLCRFVPVISFNLINYTAGLTRISWWTFTWTTGIGILPLTTLMVVMGHQIDSLTPEIWLLLLAAAVALWWWVRKKVHFELPEGRIKMHLADVQRLRFSGGDARECRGRPTSDDRTEFAELRAAATRMAARLLLDLLRALAGAGIRRVRSRLVRKSGEAGRDT